jgi:poly-gamma-glutamate synthase PgsB/CapB
MIMSELNVESLLRLNLSPDWIRIKGNLLTRLEENFIGWQGKITALEGIDKENRQAIQLVQFLLEQTNRWIREIQEQRQQLNQFSEHYRKAENHEEARQYLIDIARVLNYSKVARKKILRDQAPWIDEHAIHDGHAKRQAEKEQNVSNTLQRLSDILPHLLTQAPVSSLPAIWQLVSLYSSLQPALQYAGNIHIRIQAFACLSKTLATFNSLSQTFDNKVPANIMQYIYRTCLDEELNIWLRSEALDLISQFDQEQFLTLVKKLFVSQPAKDMYLRGRIAQLFCDFTATNFDNEQHNKTLAIIAQDSSDYVRQTLIKHAIGLTAGQCIKLLSQRIDVEKCAKVRGQIYLTLAKLLNQHAKLVDQILTIQITRLAHENDDFALRCLLHTLPGCAAQLMSGDYVRQIQQQLKLTQNIPHSAPVLGWLSSTYEHLWALSHALLPDVISEQLQQLPLHQKMTFKISTQTNRDDLQRYLASIGRQRYGFDIKDKGQTITVRAGFKFGFRFWRFWHELRTPATDKRENHNHLKGRLYYGLSQTGTHRMAEMSATKVPGEPLFIESEQGWRDYLPLLDQILSSLDQGWPTQAVKIYSAEGITSIMPPKGLLARLYARTVIQFRFAQFAELRNWQEKSNQSASQYIMSLNKLGFDISIKGYLNQQGDVEPVNNTVQRFFPSLALPITLPGWTDMQNYFYSVYQNTLGQLIAFTGVATVGYLGTHLTKLLQMRHARSKIPLVIGGWGTRGKSGTERLKAALFGAMGLSVVSKTTGCEAMFLFGPANRPMKEMFLFRPYDKASIWEQVFLTRLTAKLGADVFLWECMGLTPRYIDIIQNQWMRDDISTITNCYPDHEDLQGPAGIEIPIVMQRFVPKNSVLVASEESMLPLLQDAALQKNSTLLSVTWLESGLLTDDVIARFPYEEHPNNIALVAQMADVLDIPQDFAIKEMADNVVADLGVLKIYPQAQVQQRRLIFINGMSANERLGAMGNWQRTGLAEQDLATNPEQWLGIVINNRADRVARSKVFATMLVQDTQADCYFFIGDNLGGFTNYIIEAWHSYTNKLDLDSVERFGEQAKKFRIATDQELVLRRLKASISGLTDVDPTLVECMPEQVDQSSLDNWCLRESIGVSTEVAQAITAQFKRDAGEYLEFQNFEKQFDAQQQQPMLDWLLVCFQRRWVILEDYYSKGNQTLNTLVKHTPPGLISRIIGVQNIKGTGLDFIYRWQFWDRVHQSCQILLTSRDETELSETLKSLTTWEEFGLLEEHKVRQTLVQVKNRSEAQTEHIQAQLYIVEQRLDQQLVAVGLLLQGTRSQSKAWRWLLNGVEAFLDAGDAIKRRKTADKIYQAMLENLISYDRASLELTKITQAQKGGWMIDRMKRIFERG